MEAAGSIYLASQSPRRRELLQQIGVPHEVVSASVLEQPLQNESADTYVQRLALEKAQAGFAFIVQKAMSPKPVLGADTIVVSDGVILEKPRDQIQFRQMLQSLAAKTHQVMTAVALVDAANAKVLLSTTSVSFRSIDMAEIDAYWDTGEPCDKAGGYGIQGLGSVFVQRIEGSYSGVVGLPIEQTVTLLKEFGVSWWQV